EGRAAIGDVHGIANQVRVRSPRGNARQHKCDKRQKQSQRFSTHVFLPLLWLMNPPLATTHDAEPDERRADQHERSWLGNGFNVALQKDTVVRISNRFCASAKCEK